MERGLEIKSHHAGVVADFLDVMPKAAPRKKERKHDVSALRDRCVREVFADSVAHELQQLCHEGADVNKMVSAWEHSLKVSEFQRGATTWVTSSLKLESINPPTGRENYEL